MEQEVTVRFDLHAQHNRVVRNRLEYLGGTGVLLAGYGPGTRDVSKHNVVSENHIHHCGELHWHVTAKLLGV